LPLPQSCDLTALLGSWPPSCMESTAAAWASWISLGLIILASAALLASKNWIIARITRGVQHGFDIKLEEIRTTLRNNEEQFRSGLRAKETEIDALRNNVLSGSASRQTLLDKRRFEAVEKIWTAVNDLAPLRNLYQMMAHLYYDALAKQVRDPKIQQFLSTLDTTGSDQQNWKNVARDERPFVPEITWAYFSAYTTLLTFNLVRYKTLKLGIEEPQKFFNTENVKNILKAALPHHAQFIDGEQDPGAYYYLIEEIETMLLNELRRILDGKEASIASAEQGKEILNTIQKIKDEKAKENIDAGLSA
jgi:hypothetical protein